MSVKIDSCERILFILNCKDGTEVDKIALFRECQSPRTEIEQRIHWVCFEAEMKLQIWKLQYETFRTLFEDNSSGSVSQLNMGEGKTQVIIPMIAL